jgi:hypothetical protein
MITYFFDSIEYICNQNNIQNEIVVLKIFQLFSTVHFIYFKMTTLDKERMELLKKYICDCFINNINFLSLLKQIVVKKMVCVIFHWIEPTQSSTISIVYSVW